MGDGGEGGACPTSTRWRKSILQHRLLELFLSFFASGVVTVAAREGRENCAKHGATCSSFHCILYTVQALG